MTERPMETLLTNMEQATAEWLTQALRKAGVLGQGHVTSVQQQSVETTSTSVIAFLELSYSYDSPPSAPSRLVLKVSKPNMAPEKFALGKREVTFYTTVAGAMSNPPVVRCYDAVYSPATGQSHLLIEDVSATHFQPAWPLPPLRLYCEQVMDCMAQFHGFWWEHPRLGKGIGTLPTKEVFHNYLRERERIFRNFVDFAGDRFSLERRAIYEKVFAALPALWERQKQARRTETAGLTIMHGDAHFWSFMYPSDPTRDTIRIIDWQAWRVGRSTEDLAYMITLDWYPERRHAMEKAMIRRYYDGLLQHGVTQYTWDKCWEDYRVSVIRSLLIPVWQWSVNLGPAIWWPHLERVVLAYQDLGCAELLEK